ncbi:hypothetical protein D3C81_2105010 [compost metagenome]
MQGNRAQLSQCRQCGAPHILSTRTSRPVAVEDFIVDLQLDAFHHNTQLRRMPLQAMISLLDTTENGLGWQALELILFHPPQHEYANRTPQLLA